MGLLKNQAIASKSKKRKSKATALAQPVKSNNVPKPIARKSKPKATKPIPKGVMESFSHWFCHGWEAIEKKDGKTWITLKYPLATGKILELWKDPTTAIGLRFGKETRYGMLDIDAGSKYHNPEGLDRIKDALAILGIEDSLLIQSSHSTGWHLYFFLPQAIATFALACGLQDALEMAGLELKPGQLEAFPNRKGRTKNGFVAYNGHRLPLQTGSALLDADGNPYSQSIQSFLRQAEMVSECVDFDLLLNTCQDAHNRYTARLFSGKAKHQPLAKQFGGRRLLKELNTIIETGWTAHGQSMDILGTIAAKGRIFHGLGGEELADWVYRTAINAPGFYDYCRHEKECPAWAARWAKCAERKYYPYGSRNGGDFKPPKEAGPTNEEKQADARKRIVEAIADFKASGRAWPSTIRARRLLIAKMACCSERTLAKAEYLSLWHPDHQSKAVTPMPYTEQVSGISPERDHTTPITWGASSFPGRAEKKITSSSQPRESDCDRLTSAICTTPVASLKTKTTQTHTGKVIELFQVTMNVPNSEITNGKPRIRIVNRPVVAIANDPNPAGLKPGDWVIEPDRPDRLMKLASIDDDGEWCRLVKPDCQQPGLIGSLAYLPELQHAPPELIAEYFPNGDRGHQSNGGSAHG
jgi:hypothetical protein